LGANDFQKAALGLRCSLPWQRRLVASRKINR